MLAVEGEADHAKRRACVIARRSSTKYSCGLRLIPVPDGTLANALGELAPELRDQIMQRLASGNCQIVEIHIRIALINRFNALGQAES